MQPQPHTNHLPHLVMIAVLAFGAYSLPSVKDAMAGGFDVLINSNVEATTTAPQRYAPRPPQQNKHPMRPASSTSTDSLESKRPAGCPERYHCIPKSVILTEGCPANHVCVPAPKMEKMDKVEKMEMKFDDKKEKFLQNHQQNGNGVGVGSGTSSVVKGALMPPKMIGQQKQAPQPIQ